MPKTTSLPHWPTKFASVLTAASAVAATACSGADADGSAQGDGEPTEPMVLTTFTVLQDMTSEVAGDSIDVRSITPEGAEVHEYDPTPSDIRDAAEADLVLKNGLGLEEWFGQFLQHAEAPSVTVAEGVDTLPVTRLPGHPDAAGSEADMPVNPHAWMSPVQAQVYVDNIEEALSEHFPDHAEQFAANAAQYRQQLEDVHQDARARFEALEATAHLVTCEGAFSYLADEYGLGEHYLWPMNAEDEGTAAQAQAQIDYVEEHDVPVVFCESTVNDSAQQQVVAATEAELGSDLYVDSLTAADGPAPRYIDLLTYDIDLILDAHE